MLTMLIKKQNVFMLDKNFTNKKLLACRNIKAAENAYNYAVKA
jgi:hypothetical protein